MNMKSIIPAFLAAVLAVGSATAASAQTGTPGIDARQHNQAQRIRQGVRSGELTRREARHLRRGQHRIQRMENRAKADGVVTARERRRIHHAQNVQSRRIFNKKHNLPAR
jgi:hypothetical protein